MSYLGYEGRDFFDASYQTNQEAWEGEEYEDSGGPGNKRQRTEGPVGSQAAIVTTIAGRPHEQSGLSFAEKAASFEEAADRTGWFADGDDQACRFRCPMGAVQADDGTIYVADWGNHCIRKRTSNGVWSVLVGKPGERGFKDGPGTVARFNNVARITIDPQTGDLVVTDRDNHCVRRVILIDGGAAAVVTTIAGGGAQATLGQAGYADATALDARFNSPVGVAVADNGNIYVSDLCNHCIRLVTRGGFVSTYCGKGGERGYADGVRDKARFLFPRGLCMDSSKNLILCDGGNHCVRRVTGRGVVTTIAGLGGVSGYADGVGSTVRFHFPGDLAVDGRGVILVADTINNCIRKISEDAEVTTVAGVPMEEGFVDSDPSTGLGGLFSHPSNLFVDHTGAIVVTDTYNHSIRHVDARMTAPRRGALPSTFSADMLSVLRSAAHADVTLVAADSVQIPAHRNILCARCSYFREYFASSGQREGRGGSAEVLTVESGAAAIRIVLEYLYSDEVSQQELLLQEDVHSEVEALAYKWDLPRLRALMSSSSSSTLESGSLSSCCGLPLMSSDNAASFSYLPHASSAYPTLDYEH